MSAEDNAVLLDYCLEHGLTPMTYMNHVEGEPDLVSIQWAYRTALEEPAGSTLRALAQRVVVGARGVRRVYTVKTGGVMIPGPVESRTFEPDADLWAQGDELRAWELTAARWCSKREVQSGLSSVEQWESPPGVPIEVLWRAFIQAAAVFASSHATALLGDPWPGVDCVDALLTERWRQLASVCDGWALPSLQESTIKFMEGRWGPGPRLVYRNEQMSRHAEIVLHLSLEGVHPVIRMTDTSAFGFILRDWVAAAVGVIFPTSTPGPQPWAQPREQP